MKPDEPRDRVPRGDGELGEERAAVERHLRWCPNCRRLPRNLGRTATGLRRLADTPPGG